MSELNPIKYTRELFFTHARRPGERRTICGAYSLLTADFDGEELWYEGPLCRSCSRGLTEDFSADPLGAADELAQSHAAFHGLPDLLIYSDCPWAGCNFWEAASFLQASPHRLALSPHDQIRDAHGRFHDLPGALVDDEGDLEICAFDSIARLMINDYPTDSNEDHHERFHDRPAALFDTEPCTDPHCRFATISTFIGSQWHRPDLAGDEILTDAHGRFHDLPGAHFSDDCGLHQCTFGAVSSFLNSPHE